MLGCGGEEANFVSLLHLAVDDAEEDDDSAVGVVVGVKDEGAEVGVGFRFLGRWDFGDDLLEDVVDSNAGFGGGVDYFTAVEADCLLNFFCYSVRICVDEKRKKKKERMKINNQELKFGTNTKFEGF